jgi:predicted CoA-binding protein
MYGKKGKHARVACRFMVVFVKGGKVKKGRIITDGETIKEILLNCHTVAVLGLSPKPERDSHMVATYLKATGYTILPVRPGQKELLGERAYASLDEIEEPVDMVNVFRKSEVVPQHAREAIRLQPKIFWMQLGIISQEAADMLTDAGIDVIMDKCIKVEHARLCKAPSC